MCELLSSKMIASAKQAIKAFCSSADQDFFVHPASGTLSGEAAEPFSDLQLAEAGPSLQLAQLHMGESETRNGI